MTGYAMAQLRVTRKELTVLMNSPDHRFDGTADGMQEVAWRGSAGPDQITPLDAFFTDFYYPSLIAETLGDDPPRARVDLATALQIPSLRVLLAQKQAHLETRNQKTLVCFHQTPGVAVRAPAGAGPEVPTEFMGYRIVPDDRTCKYQKELSGRQDAAQLTTALGSPAFRTPWDGKPSPTRNSTFHVLSVGVSLYPGTSGFDPLPYAAKSAQALESFFRTRQGADSAPYAQVRIWSDPAATAPLAYAVQLRSDRSALAVALLDRLNGVSGPVTVRQLLEHVQRTLPEASEKSVGFRQVPLISSIGFDYALPAR